MKKILTLSISLAFASTVFAGEPGTVEQLDKINSLIKNVTGMSKPATSSAATVPGTPTAIKADVKPEAKVDVKADAKIEPKKDDVKKSEEVKPAEVTANAPVKEETKVEEKKPEVKKVVKKKKKVKKVAKKAVVSAPVENKSVLVETGYFHIPKNVPTEEAGKFETPISYDDVTVNFVKFNNNSSSFDAKVRYDVSLTDKRTGKPLETYNLSDKNIYGLAVKTDLSNAQFSKNTFVEGAGHGVDLTEDGTCQALFVKYQLKTQAEPTVVTKFLDDKGNLVDQAPTNCEANKVDTKDTTFYTKNSNIVNVGFNQKSLANHTLGMIVHFNREGREFFPAKTISFAIPTDFSKFYALNAKQDHRSAFFGVNFSQSVPSGAYYVLVGFEQDNKFEWIKTGTSVQ